MATPCGFHFRLRLRAGGSSHTWSCSSLQRTFMPLLKIGCLPASLLPGSGCRTTGASPAKLAPTQHPLLFDFMSGFMHSMVTSLFDLMHICVSVRVPWG